MADEKEAPASAQLEELRGQLEELRKDHEELGLLLIASI